MTKSFLRGIGTVLELFAPEREVFKVSLPSHSDEEALRNDWQQVGDDMYHAFHKVNDEELKNF